MPKTPVWDEPQRVCFIGRLAKFVSQKRQKCYNEYRSDKGGFWYKIVKSLYYVNPSFDMSDIKIIYTPDRAVMPKATVFMKSMQAQLRPEETKVRTGVV